MSALDDLNKLTLDVQQKLNDAQRKRDEDLAKQEEERQRLIKDAQDKYNESVKNMRDQEGASRLSIQQQIALGPTGALQEHERRQSVGKATDKAIVDAKVATDTYVNDVNTTTDSNKKSISDNYNTYKTDINNYIVDVNSQKATIQSYLDKGYTIETNADGTYVFVPPSTPVTTPVMGPVAPLPGETKEQYTQRITPAPPTKTEIAQQRAIGYAERHAPTLTRTESFDKGILKYATDQVSWLENNIKAGTTVQGLTIEQMKSELVKAKNNVQRLKRYREDYVTGKLDMEGMAFVTPFEQAYKEYLKRPWYEKAGGAIIQSGASGWEGMKDYLGKQTTSYGSLKTLGVTPYTPGEFRKAFYNPTINWETQLQQEEQTWKPEDKWKAKLVVGSRYVAQSPYYQITNAAVTGWGFGNVYRSVSPVVQQGIKFAGYGSIAGTGVNVGRTFQSKGLEAAKVELLATGATFGAGALGFGSSIRGARFESPVKWNIKSYEKTGTITGQKYYQLGGEKYNIKIPISRTKGTSLETFKSYVTQKTGVKFEVPSSQKGTTYKPPEYKPQLPSHIEVPQWASEGSVGYKVYTKAPKPIVTTKIAPGIEFVAPSKPFQEITPIVGKPNVKIGDFGSFSKFQSKASGLQPSGLDLPSLPPHVTPWSSSPLGILSKNNFASLTKFQEKATGLHPWYLETPALPSYNKLWKVSKNPLSTINYSSMTNFQVKSTKLQPWMLETPALPPHVTSWKPTKGGLSTNTFSSMTKFQEKATGLHPWYLETPALPAHVKSPLSKTLKFTTKVKSEQFPNMKHEIGPGGIDVWKPKVPGKILTPGHGVSVRRGFVSPNVKPATEWIPNYETALSTKVWPKPMLFKWIAPGKLVVWEPILSFFAPLAGSTTPVVKITWKTKTYTFTDLVKKGVISQPTGGFVGGGSKQQYYQVLHQEQVAKTTISQIEKSLVQAHENMVRLNSKLKQIQNSKMDTQLKTNALRQINNVKSEFEQYVQSLRVSQQEWRQELKQLSRQEQIVSQEQKSGERQILIQPSLTTSIQRQDQISFQAQRQISLQKQKQLQLQKQTQITKQKQMFKFVTPDDASKKKRKFYYGPKPITFGAGFRERHFTVATPFTVGKAKTITFTPVNWRMKK
jgi:hypothetical protein